jgi:hypothetical protein
MSGPPGPVGNLDVRVIVNQASASCDASELLLSAYCENGAGTLRIIGVVGASCEGAPDAKAIVVCAKR